MTDYGAPEFRVDDVDTFREGDHPVSAQDRLPDREWVVAFLRRVVASGEPLTDVDVDNIEAAFAAGVSVPAEPGALPVPEPLRDAAGRSPEWYDGYNAAMRDYDKRRPAPEPSARSEDVVRMDGYLAGLHDAEAVLAPEPSALREARAFIEQWGTYRESCREAGVWSPADETMWTAGEPLRAALAATPQDPEP